MLIGRIVNWRDDKGYGFVKPVDGGPEVFLHISAFTPRRIRPEGNELVRYELVRDARGRPQAVSVTFVGGGKRNSRVQRNPVPLLLVLAFFGSLAALVVTNRIPVMLVGVYAAACLITFIAYAHDKSAAKRGNWRTSEETLLLFGLVGGWPGGLLAQGVLRHKSRKIECMIPFWVTVVLNVIGLWWLTTPQGNAMLERAIDLALAI